MQLNVGDQLIAPERCSPKPTSLICDDDGSYLVLEQGEELELTFSLPEEAIDACIAGDVHVIADGYYLPHALKELDVSQSR